MKTLVISVNPYVARSYDNFFVTILLGMVFAI